MTTPNSDESLAASRRRHPSYQAGENRTLDAVAADIAASQPRSSSVRSGKRPLPPATSYHNRLPITITPDESEDTPGGFTAGILALLALLALLAAVVYIAWQVTRVIL